MRFYKGWKRHKHGGRATYYSNGDLRIYRQTDGWLLTMCGGKAVEKFDTLTAAILSATDSEGRSTGFITGR